MDGRRIASAAAGCAQQQGHRVVSGGARGIDAAAHRGALDNTVVVLAGGLDRWYPRECYELFEAVKRHGTLLSEMPLGTSPRAPLFPVRNRIIAALCSRLLVVQGRCDSGSLITARQALDMDREIWAVPGSPLLEQAQGPNELIRDGAHVWLMDSRWGQTHVPVQQPSCELGHALAENHATAAELADCLGWSLGQVMSRLAELKLSGSIRVVAGRYGWRT